MNKVLLRPLFREAYLKKTEKKLPVKKFNVGGFSKVEKRNLLLTPITSALLQARRMPGESQLGSVFRSIGKGMEKLPQTQLAIKQIELEEQAREENRKIEKAKQKKIASTKTVYDQDLGKNVLATEEQIQGSGSIKYPGQMRYLPEKKEPKTDSFQSVWNTETQSEQFVPKSQLTMKNSQGEPLFVPVGNKASPIPVYPIDPETGEQGDMIFITKAEVLDPKNKGLYKPQEGNVEAMLKVTDIQRSKKLKSDAEVRMTNARDVLNIITDIRDNVRKKGAFTGRAGDAVLNIAGVTGFVDSFLNRRKKEEKNFEQDYAEAYNFVNNELTNPDSDKFNTKITRYLNAPETQQARTSIIDLAYAIAKVREPGGRFSVPDITLALESIGNSSNIEVFEAGLKQIGLNTARGAINNYKDRFNVSRDEIPGNFEDLLKGFDNLRGLNVEENDMADISPGSWN
jgi:hypothetical protein